VRPRIGPSLAVLFLVNVLNFYDRNALSSVIEPLRHEFHLNDTQLGGLVTTFTVVYALAGLPLGRLADTGSRKRLLAVGVAVWTGLTALGGLAVNYATLLVTRLGVGIGEAVCTPAAASWIGDMVPATQRARAMAGFMMAVPVGLMLSFAISGPVAQAYGWRAALMLAAAPGLVLAPALLRLTEPERTIAKAAPGGSFQTAAFWWIAVSGALLNFGVYSFSTFVRAFLTRYHGLSVGQAGVWRASAPELSASSAESPRASRATASSARAPTDACSWPPPHPCWPRCRHSRPSVSRPATWPPPSRS